MMVKQIVVKHCDEKTNCGEKVSAQMVFQIKQKY